MSSEAQFPVYKYGISLNELPDMISFYLQFHSCNIKCKGCHSAYLCGTYKKYLTLSDIVGLVQEAKHKGADSVIIFGDINNDVSTENLSLLCRGISKLLPVCIYSGANSVMDSLGDKNILSYLSYIKLGNFDGTYGGLANRNTNQHLYEVSNGEITEDITYKFWRR